MSDVSSETQAPAIPNGQPKRPRLFPKSALNLLGLIVALALIIAYLHFRVKGGYVNWANFESLGRQTAIVALVALGMTYVIVSGAIDLSVGSIVAFVSVVVAYLLQKNQSPFVAAAGGVAAGAVCGLLNGLLVTRLKVGPFIVTLGTMLMVRGIAKGLAGEQKIDAEITWLNDLLALLGKNEHWKIFSAGVWLTLILAVLLGLALRYTRFGRHVVAVGSNEQAARLCGIPVERVKFGVFVLSGACAGLAGLMMFARLSVGDPTVGQGLELDAIAAVVIGGASLSGGEGSIVGSILGAVIMSTIRAGGTQLELANWVQEILTGAIIVLAVGLDRLRVRRQA